MYLEHGQGMSISEQQRFDSRASAGNNQGTPGYKLRSAGPGATNASGFSGLLAGMRLNDGSFRNRDEEHGYWWSSSDEKGRWLDVSSPGVERTRPERDYAFSVRCLKD
jgi:uncharacterized protein (TIGR02145 family)